MNYAPASLPDHILEQLLHGAVGKYHLLQLADTTLSNVEHFELGMDLALAAWESDLLDGSLAAQLPVIFANRTALPAKVRTLAHLVASSWKQPRDISYLTRLLRKHDTGKTKNYLDTQQKKQAKNLFWLQQALGIGAYERDYDWLFIWLERGEYPQAVQNKVRGDIYFFQEEYASAATHYAAALKDVPCDTFKVRLAESLFRLGKQEQAVDLWSECIQARPWHTNLILRAYDVLLGRSTETKALQGRVAVLLYTYNKAEEIDQVLGALQASIKDNIELVVLNNGSTDGVAAVLRKWKDVYSENKLRVIELPVNVGAPAARNWLMQMEALQSCTWMAYLDDDALPPANWLEMLGAAVNYYPDAGAWGCRVVDAYNPSVLQSVDLHLCDAPEMELTTDGVTPVYQRRFSFSRIHHQDLDLGQFSYVRPCVSVTGCCHLFKRETLLAAGGFDLRFTPSQYDDVDHDIRLALAEKGVVYHGHLRVEHMKRTGRLGRQDGPEQARALGNMYKLQMKYSSEEIQRLRESHRKILLKDLVEKKEYLQGVGVEILWGS